MGDGASSSRSSTEGRGEGRERGRNGETVVIDYGRRRTSCGYCRSTSKSSVAHGLWFNSITAEDYQELLDHGWRRFGCFIYKPEMEKTCCPSYTIRLKASDFFPSKEQARVHKRMQRFFDGTISMKKSDSTKQKINSSMGSLTLAGNKSEMKMTESSRKESSASTCDNLHNEYDLPKAVVKKVTPQAKKTLMEISEDLVYSSSIAFQVAATIRHCQTTDVIIRCQESELLDLKPTAIAEKLAYLVKQHEIPFELLTEACNGHLNFYSPTKQVSSEFINSKEKTQASKGDGGNTESTCTADSSVVLPKKRRKVEIRMKRASFDHEEFALYKSNQIKVHDDKPENVTVNSYKIFLVDTPIVFIPPASSDNMIPPCGLGSFHQQYLIDGKLVVVGVVDILSRCLSSKYLFWDPDFAFLSLGTYSALQEIIWVKETQNHCPHLQHYYLGYYIHSCRYKAAYQPSELLCSLRYQWVPFEVARPLLDGNPCVVLSDSLAEHGCAMSPNHRNSVETSGTDPHYRAPIEDFSGEDEDEDGFLYDDSDTA